MLSPESPLSHLVDVLHSTDKILDTLILYAVSRGAYLLSRLTRTALIISIWSAGVLTA